MRLKLFGTPASLFFRGACHRKSGYKSQPWHEADFDSEYEVLLWRLTESDVVPYGDVYMLKLSELRPGKRAAGKPAAEDKAMEKKFPAITLLMTATADDDGKPREVATMTIVCEDGLWKGGIRDRDSQASLWRSGTSLDALMVNLEAALVSGAADWRASDKSSRK